MNSQRFGTTNVAICTYVEGIDIALVEKAAVFCHNFLPTTLLHRQDPFFQGILAIASP
jgi:hypothetical protein